MAPNVLIDKKYRILFHLLFWMVYIAVITLFFGEMVGVRKVFYRTLISFLFNAFLVYFNFYYLLPRYFEKRKYLVYLILLHLALAVVTVLRVYTDSLFPIVETNETIHKYLFSFTHIASVIVSGYMLLLLSMSLKFIKDYFVNIDLRNRLKYQKVENELQQLKNQINPHFLFNVLGNIYSLAYMKSDKAPVMISKLSDMMRYVLYDCSEEKVLLSKEIEYLRDFIDLHNMRKDNKMNIIFEVEGTPGNLLIQPMLFLPLFENCFKHGNLEKIDKGWMKSKFIISGNSLMLDIENTFDKKEDEEHGNKSGGIGSQNIKERLELLYPGKHSLEFQEYKDVFSVKLIINFE